MQVETMNPADAVDRPAGRGPRIGPREKLGELIGACWAPVVAAISRARQARMFHPTGLTFLGRVEPIACGHPELASLGHRLAGNVLARCSAALWRHPLQHVEVLGIALRFRPGALGLVFDEHPTPRDQDLLLATIQSPWTMPLAPWTTRADDFLANTFWAVSPFEIAPGRGGTLRVKLRMRPLDDWRGGDTRDDRLRYAIVAGRARWRLEARRTLTRTWHPIAQIALHEEIDLDQQALRFDPYRIGAGIVPVGTIQAIRRATYTASQDARLSR
jgi:hypothetical protein